MLNNNQYDNNWLQLEGIFSRKSMNYDEALHQVEVMDVPIFPVSAKPGKKTPLVSGGFNQLPRTFQPS